MTRSIIYPTITPLSLYIHFPWCISKCPYCDFLSYPQPQLITNSPSIKLQNFSTLADHYIEALLQDLQQDLLAFTIDRKKPIISIYIGGGTPSLIPANTIVKLLENIYLQYKIDNHAEITIEANPDTIDYHYCKQLYQAGINRLSIGAQSFQDDKLKILGRIHNAASITHAIVAARHAGFTNINLDLMFGLPTQSINDALYDLKTAIALAPTHISWYQFTLETGSIFYRKPPNNIPNDECTWQMQQLGQQILSENNFKQYEVSAYGRHGYQCQHNLNYWQFGDYLGIGAGAHGKLTLKKKNNHPTDDCDTQINSNADDGSNNGHTINTITRYSKINNPHLYNNVIHKRNKNSSDADNKNNTNHISNTINCKNNFITTRKIIAPQELPFEFMLNALRLYQPIAYTLFINRTGLPLIKIVDKLKLAEEFGLIRLSTKHFTTTTKGKNFINDLLEIFMV